MTQFMMIEDRQVLEQRVEFLMTAVQLSSEVQLTWRKILPKLSEDELQKVCASLEREYLVAVTKSDDDDLVRDLQKLNGDKLQDTSLKSTLKEKISKILKYDEGRANS